MHLIMTHLISSFFFKVSDEFDVSEFIQMISHFFAGMRRLHT